LTEADIQADLDRRRPGQSEIVSPRDEEDKCQILSGVFEGLTLGTPISVLVWNKDARPEAYREMERRFGRLTPITLTRPNTGSATGRAAGALRPRDDRSGCRRGHRKEGAEQGFSRIEIVAYVKSAHRIEEEVDPATVDIAAVERRSQMP
jgi:chorismate synthase